MNKSQRPMPTHEVEHLVYDSILDIETTETVREGIGFENRINHRNEFELSYLRWRYFMRAKNPSDKAIKQYEKAAHYCARKSYAINAAAYKSSGMELEDVSSISMVYLVSYLGAYSIEFIRSERKKYSDFIKETTGIKPKIEDIRKKDLSKMICFIQQRLLDLVRVCRQKNKNITGEHIIKGIFILEGKEKDCSDWALLHSPSVFGFRKVNLEELREIKRNIKGNQMPQGRFKVAGKVYRNAMYTTSVVHIDDYEHKDDIAIFNPQEDDSDFTQSEKLQNRYRMERLLDIYKKAPFKKKSKMLRRLIRMIENKPEFKDQLLLARNMLFKVESKYAK